VQAETDASWSTFRKKTAIVIFGTDTPMGRHFDVALLVLILLSVVVVMLESMQSMREQWGPPLIAAEWILTTIFTVEYALRLWSTRRRLRYATSFFGIIDFLSILPTYLGLLAGAGSGLVVLRSLRLLRVFRILKLAHFMGEANILLLALRRSRAKISVFLGTVIILSVIMGAFMYMIEGPEHGFTSIPRGVYWAIVTLTTVGYGDIHPHTELGQVLAAVVMIMGYGIIAVPTGIVSVEIADASRLRHGEKICASCRVQDHSADADYCRRCGSLLGPKIADESNEDL
jgi:voltage-gated potassium channel